MRVIVIKGGAVVLGVIAGALAWWMMGGGVFPLVLASLLAVIVSWALISVAGLVLPSGSDEEAAPDEGAPAASPSSRAPATPAPPLVSEAETSSLIASPVIIERPPTASRSKAAPLIIEPPPTSPKAAPLPPPDWSKTPEWRSSGRFDVIFSGQLVEGYQPEAVKGSLAEAFGLEMERVEALFSGGDRPVKRNTDFRTAAEYAEAFEAAGALCRVQPHAELEPKPRASSSSLPAPPLSPGHWRVISPRNRAADSSLSPIRCRRVTPEPGAISADSPRGQERHPLEEVQVLSVVEHSYEGERSLKLLFFVEGVHRPYVVEAGDMDHSRFPGDAEGDADPAVALRRTLRAFLEGQRSLAVDGGTAAFLDGRPPIEFSGDLARLATALKAAL